MKKAFVLGMLCTGSVFCFAEEASYHFEGDITAHMREVAATIPAWLTYSYKGVSYFQSWSHEDKLFDGVVQSPNQDNERLIVKSWKDVPLRYDIDSHYCPAADIVITRYEFVTASSAPARAPRAWTFEGSNDGETWTVIDARSSIATATETLLTMSYDVPAENRASYRNYRFKVSEVGKHLGDGTYLSLQELRLFGTIDGGRGLTFDDCEFSGERVLTTDVNGTPVDPPALTVTIGGKTLVEGEDKDYSVDWPVLAPGKRYATVTGHGIFEGCVTNLGYVVQMDITKYMRERFPAWVNWAAPGKGFFTYNGGILLDLDHAFDGKIDAKDAERCLFDQTKCDGKNMLPVDIRYSIPRSFRRGAGLTLTSYRITGVSGTSTVAPGRQFRDWELYGSTDGEDWALLDEHTGGGVPTAPNAETYPIAEDRRGDYRRFRLHVTDGGKDGYMGVQEIQFFGYFEGGTEPTDAPAFEDYQIDSIPACGYSGSAVEPPISVSFGEMTLGAEHYDVSYENNVAPGPNAIAKATGKGSYSGVLSRTFSIDPSLDVDLTAAARQMESGCSYRMTGGTKYYPRSGATDVDSLDNLFDGVTDQDGTARCLIEFTPDASEVSTFTNNPVCIYYDFTRNFAKGHQIVLTGYEFVLQGTSQHWHPGSWTLSGSRDGVTWTELDVQEAAVAAGSRGGEVLRFAIDESRQAPYRRYRLTVTATAAYDSVWKMNILGLREMRLIGKKTPSNSGLVILLF